LSCHKFFVRKIPYPLIIRILENIRKLSLASIERIAGRLIYCLFNKSLIFKSKKNPLEISSGIAFIYYLMKQRIITDFDFKEMYCTNKGNVI